MTHQVREALEPWSGVPPNDHADGYHWLKRKQDGELMPFGWTADVGGPGEGDWETDGDYTPEEMAADFDYIAPCVPPDTALSPLAAQPETVTSVTLPVRWIADERTQNLFVGDDWRGSIEAPTALCNEWRLRWLQINADGSCSWPIVRAETEALAKSALLAKLAGGG